MGKIADYVQAMLQNPEWMKTIAKRYGELQESPAGTMVCNVSMAQLATAIHDLEKALINLEVPTN